MPISNTQWRVEVGMYVRNSCAPVFKKRRNNVFCNIWVGVRLILSVFIFCFIASAIMLLTIFPVVLLYSLLSNFINFDFEEFIMRLLFFLIRLIFMLCSILKVSMFYCTDSNHQRVIVNHCTYIFLILILLPHLRLYFLLCGDVELNPGPVNNALNLCHWNLNGIAARKFVKMTHLEALSAAHSLDIICISETFLDSEFPNDDPRLRLKGYEMLRSDFAGNSKRGGVCVYYKEDLPLVERSDLSTLDQCLVLEIKVKRSKCFVSCFYRSPNDCDEERNRFCQNLELICSKIASENPVASFVLGDFNAKSTRWWQPGGDNACGLLLEDISTTYAYSQLINEPTNFEPGDEPSCIDLFFTTQPNLVIESGVIPSPLSFCHHQIIFGKIKFDYFRPPPYLREVWHFEKANADLIKRSVSSFDWERSFAGIGVDQQVDLLTSTLLNICRNFIPHETISCKEKDPPWITDEMKKSLRRKNRLYKKYISRGRTDEDKTNFDLCNTQCESLITESKNRYYLKLSEKLNNPLTSSKAYWATLNRFLKKGKIPTIPPIEHEGEIVTDFSRKANLFNNFFADQCTILDNGSTLPEFSYLTEHRISEVEFSDERISKVIKDLNPNKARGCDEISIKMLHLCGNTIVFPLRLIFRNALDCGIFPVNWKKATLLQFIKSPINS